MKLAIALTLLASCATVMPLGASLGRERDEEVESEPPSKFSRCEVMWFIVGMLIDGVVVAGDIAYGEKIDAVAALIFVPAGLDVLIASAAMGKCLSD